MPSNQPRQTVPDAVSFTSIQQDAYEVIRGRTVYSEQDARYAYAALLLQMKGLCHLQLQALIQGSWIQEQIHAFLNEIPLPPEQIPFATVKSALDLVEEFTRNRSWIHGIREVDEDEQAGWSAYNAHTHIATLFGRDEWFEMAAGILGLHLCLSQLGNDKIGRDTLGVYGRSAFDEYTKDDWAIRDAARMADKVREETLELNGGDTEDTYLYVKNDKLKKYVLWFNDYFTAIKCDNRDDTGAACVAPPAPAPAPAYSHARVEEMRRQFIAMEMGDDEDQLGINKKEEDQFHPTR
ncbi:hypothetical protein KJ359_003595 [Pestalotiopsis sp. 9143b]|nr:hypothetical protein KJ359_003595 [Pestalotiopsis sp. 9143b]